MDLRALAFAALLAATALALVVTTAGLLWRGLRKGLVQKELQHFFLSPIAWLTLAAFALVNGFSFLFLFDLYQGRPNEPLVRVFFGSPRSFFWILQLIVIPAITMRLVAEERSTGTLETLMTAPVTESEVVFAKFAGAWMFYAAMWSTTLALLGAAFHYAASAGIAGLLEPAPGSAGAAQTLWQRVNAVMDMGPVATAYLGTMLMGGAWIAIGLLTSSFCRNQVVAFIASFVVLLGLFAVGFLEPLVETDPIPGFRDAIRFVSFPSAFDPFPRGVIDTRPVVYFLSLTVLSLFLATRVVESAKWR